MGCLYRLTSPSGKSYIGVTMKTAEQRFKQHIRDARSLRTRRLIGRAIERYKPENFTVETLVVSDSLVYLQELEVRAIAVFKTLWPKGGYNGCAGGNGAIAITKEAERRRIEKMRKTMETPAYKETQRRVQAIVWTEGRRKARAAETKALWKDSDYRNRLREAHAGVKPSLETRAKMSAAQKKRFGSKAS